MVMLYIPVCSLLGEYYRILYKAVPMLTIDTYEYVH